MITPKRSYQTQNLIGAIMKEEYINEMAWNQIFEFLKSSKGIYIGSEKKCKRFIEAVYWMSRTGTQWREMHDKYGNWNTVYKRFNAWSKKKYGEICYNFVLRKLI